MYWLISGYFEATAVNISIIFYLKLKCYNVFEH